MAIQIINIGGAPILWSNTKDAFDIANANFEYLDTKAAGASDPTNTTPFDTTPTVIDTFDITVHRGMKYVVTFQDRDNNEYYSTEMLVMHDDAGDSTVPTAYKTQYATISTMTADPVITVGINGANVEVTVTAAAGADNIVSFQRLATATL